MVSFFFSVCLGFRLDQETPCSLPVSLQLSERKETPPEMLSFGWQRATILGSFFNGVFLLALGLSIFLQSIERFVSLERKWSSISSTMI